MALGLLGALGASPGGGRSTAIGAGGAPDTASATLQAYVIGIPDRDKDEVVAAVLELHGAAATDAGATVAFCRERLASYKVPTRLVSQGRRPARFTNLDYAKSSPRIGVSTRSHDQEAFIA